MAQASTSSKKTEETDQVVLGPDGKPCKLCTSNAGFKKLMAMSATSSKPAQRKPRTEMEFERHCPPDVEILGRHTWTFLHSTAAYYPDQPKPAQKSAMSTLLNALPSLYPCSHCAEELKEEIKRNPVDAAVQDRNSLSLWMCQVHNEVNQRLGKDLFDCTKIDERWKDGWKDGTCD